MYTRSFPFGGSRMPRLFLLFSLSLCFAFWSCSSLTEEITDLREGDERVQHEIQVTQTPNTPDAAARAGQLGGPVMMQAFYWDVPAGGTWWEHVESKVSAWSAAGITSIWLPPVNKTMNGPFSMGYDPFDFYDFGEFDQQGSVETRFGSRQELESLIGSAHQEGLEVIADIVLNHNSGGNAEFNPFTGTETFTSYVPASGKFFRSYLDFHPNDMRHADEGVFGGFPDLSHVKPYVQDWLWKRPDAVAKYYKEVMGFDGWRFDYVKGFGAWVVRDWVNEVGGFSVGELWDGNAQSLEDWVNATSQTSSAFDFACYYLMEQAFDQNNLNALSGDMLWKRNPMKAVTFVANHDTDEIWRKNLAYAYILTHEGYPCIFYSDYEEWLDKERLDNLLWIRGHLAFGNTSILYVDQDEYIARRNGGPGMLVYINNADFWQERWVRTNWANTEIKDYTGHSSWQPFTQGDQWVKIQVPPRSYSIWAPVGF
ncbi:cytoplasmic alpha-amylase [Nitritalea halalkaliphila LW7]|uniref:Cytoplasmic alpha-amylase n=1 Tax=Nitritalea halalkaliphila LW7 TaxID=1189621 RepID=I5BWZ6_9BACT|nr:alpha-amylase [Nitritalea halalkaliphila]EIM74098.1 cytoplasmic alpha-amylase [Nitritalea halalkaliphila LW7]